MMESFSLLQLFRLKYQPPLPSLLHDLKSIEVEYVEQDILANKDSSNLKTIFPHTFSQPFLKFKKGKPLPSLRLKIGVVLSGGQAPGGHNVIAGLWDALKQLNPDSQLIGFLEGPQGLVKNQAVVLNEDQINAYRNQGGFDLIGSGRTKIETTKQFEAVEKTLNFHHLDGLVIIGGDDSNTNAAFLAEFCKKQNISTRIVGVPKTIDGDLKNEFIETPFGFDTACKIYSEVIGNLLKDAISAKKYYFFVKMMGRSASHVTLECALQTHVNLALIGEEIAACDLTLHDVVVLIADLISERALLNKHFGVILIPEGLLEFISECQSMINELNRLLTTHEDVISSVLHSSSQDKIRLLKEYLSPSSLECFSILPSDIQNQLLLERDSHGNVQVSKIETEKLLIELVIKELKARQQQGIYQGQFNPQAVFCGYEGRAGLPSNFDCQYCYTLGYAAALFIQSNASGYMCAIKNLVKSVDQWSIEGIPITKMLHFETRKNKQQPVIKKALVDLNGPVFKAFKQVRQQWRTSDKYCCPGPIQFEGNRELTDNRTLTLSYESRC